MPKKSRRDKASRSRKKRMRQQAISMPATSPVAVPEDRPVVSTPADSSVATKTKAPAVKYPYVADEMRQIGILAGAIMVILVVLALVL